MSDMSATPPAPQVPWAPEPGPRPRGKRLLKLAVGVGAAAGVAVGATALAQAATSSDGTPQAGAATATASGSPSTTTTVPSRPHGFEGPGRRDGGFGGPGGFAGIGGPGFGVGPLLYGQFTVQGPNGYETIAERSGTVSAVTDTSGSTWSLTVKSADGTSGTFTVDSGTSVNGGEMGIGSVKTGDTRARDGGGLGRHLDGQGGHRPDRAARPTAGLASGDPARPRRRAATRRYRQPGRARPRRRSTPRPV